MPFNFENGFDLIIALFLYAGLIVVVIGGFSASWPMIAAGCVIAFVCALVILR